MASVTKIVVKEARNSDGSLYSLSLEGTVEFEKGEIPYPMGQEKQAESKIALEGAYLMELVKAHMDKRYAKDGFQTADQIKPPNGVPKPDSPKGTEPAKQTEPDKPAGSPPSPPAKGAQRPPSPPKQGGGGLSEAQFDLIERKSKLEGGQAKINSFLRMMGLTSVLGLSKRQASDLLDSLNGKSG